MAAAWKFRCPWSGIGAGRLKESKKRKKICPGPKVFFLAERGPELIRYVALGYYDKEVAAKCGITLAALGTHMESVRRKYGIRSRTMFVSLALREGFVTLAELFSQIATKEALFISQQTATIDQHLTSPAKPVR